MDDKGKKPMREEDLPHTEGTSQDDEADESPGHRTDMELAWENLEVAKYIYEHDTGKQHAQELAGLFQRSSMSTVPSAIVAVCLCAAIIHKR